MSIIILIVSLFVATEMVVGRSAFKSTPFKGRPDVGDTCEFKNCTNKIVSSPWDTRPLVILLQRCCQECYDEQSALRWEIGR